MIFDEIRKELFGKTTKYACSFDPLLQVDVTQARFSPQDIRFNVVARSEEDVPGHGFVFHVLDAVSSEGVDGLEHRCPVGRIEQVSEEIAFGNDMRVGRVRGRMTLITTDSATIDVTYRGVLRLVGTARAWVSEQQAALEGTLAMVPFFETSDSRYQWLARTGCIAFGSWVARAGSEPALRDLTVSLDVYSAT
jgi:hypothetical protein